MKVKLTSLLIALLVGALATAGCGSNNKSSTTTTSTPAPAATSGTTSSGAGGGGETLALAADPSGQLKFDKSSLSGKAGKITLVMDNPSPVAHAIAVEGNGIDKQGQTVGKGQKSTVSVDLKAGKYTFYCPVPGHRQAGMQGTLTVK